MRVVGKVILWCGEVGKAETWVADDRGALRIGALAVAATTATLHSVRGVLECETFPLVRCTV